MPFAPPAAASPSDGKHGRHAVSLDGQPGLEIWSAGRKAAAGPVNAAGQPHGPWTEFAADGRPALTGSYDNGVRTGQWTVSTNGKPSSFFDYAGGHLMRSGALDEEGRPHGAFRFTAAPDHVADGGEGKANHGVVVGFQYFYRAGTTEHGRVREHDNDGNVIAEGGARQWKKPDRDIPYSIRDGDWKYYGADGKEIDPPEGQLAHYGENDRYRLEGSEIAWR